MKKFHLFEYQKYKNYHYNFLHSVFDIINILIIHISSFILYIYLHISSFILHYLIQLN